MQLPVVAADPFLQEDIPARLRVRAAADAPGVGCVCFPQPVPDPGVLGDIAVGHMYYIFLILFLQPVVEGPPHDPHHPKRSIGTIEDQLACATVTFPIVGTVRG